MGKAQKQLQINQGHSKGQLRDNISQAVMGHVQRQTWGHSEEEGDGTTSETIQGHLDRQATLYFPYPLFSILKSISDPGDPGFHIFTFSLIFLLVLSPQLSFDNRINHSAVSPSLPLSPLSSSFVHVYIFLCGAHSAILLFFNSVCTERPQIYVPSTVLDNVASAVFGIDWLIGNPALITDVLH